MAVKRYDGSAWQTVAGLGAQGPAATSSSIATWVKTASGGETSVSGNDDNSQPLSYTVGQELVFINGALQKRGVDYTATTGNSITGLTALAANDVVTVWTVNAFSVTNAISNTLVDAKGDLIVATAADTPGILTAGTTGQVLTVDSTTGTGLKWAAPTTTFVGCSLIGSVPTINNNTTTTLDFTSENFDSDNFHNNTTNSTRITIPTGKGGKYLFTGGGYWGGGTGIRVIYLRKNGTTDLWEGDRVAGASVTSEFAVVIDAAAGDYFEVRVYQNSGGTQTFNNGSQWGYNAFTCTYLGA